VPGHYWLTPVIVATWEAEIRRITVRGQPGHIVPKTPSPKWIGGVTQVVKHLLCKCKALSSNPRPTRKTTKKRQSKKDQSTHGSIASDHPPLKLGIAERPEMVLVNSSWVREDIREELLYELCKGSHFCVIHPSHQK
jgi:hypothetical protein